jgi:hypothetical protein
LGSYRRGPDSCRRFGDGYEAAPFPDNPTQGHGEILLLEGRRRTDAFYIGQRSAEKRRRSKGEDPMLEIEAATDNRRIAQGVVDWSGSLQPSGRNLGLFEYASTAQCCGWENCTWDSHGGNRFVADQYMSALCGRTAG